LGKAKTGRCDFFNPLISLPLPTMSEEVKREDRSLNFLEEIIENDLETGKYKSIVPFPPDRMVIYILVCYYYLLKFWTYLNISGLY
jgi:hypothetical protein